MRKCVHGCYWPDDLEVNTYCSGCRPATHMVRLWDQDEREGDEIKTVSCPICSSKEFVYISETEHHCPQCGWTQDDII